MPMIAYACADGHVEEHYYHRQDDAPDTVDCPHCPSPAAKSTDLALTLSRPPSNAQRFNPVIVDRKKGIDGEWQYSYPGASTDRLEAGYERVVLSNIASIDKFCRDRGREERELRQMQVGMEMAHWDQRTKDRREAIQQQLADRGISSSRVFDMVKKFVDRKRDARYKKLMTGGEFYNQAFSFDSSNRQGHSDASTGWKDRR